MIELEWKHAAAETMINITNTTIMHWTNYRSRPMSCSLRKDVLRNFAKFTGKHLFQSL